MAGALVKSWSDRQATVAVSLAEAELYAASKTTAELMGIVLIMADLAALEFFAATEAFTDSRAARAIASRRGRGRTRHLEVKEIWMQVAVEAKTVKIHKIRGMEHQLTRSRS